MRWSLERPLRSETLPTLNAQLSAEPTFADHSRAATVDHIADFRELASANVSRLDT